MPSFLANLFHFHAQNESTIQKYCYFCEQENNKYNIMAQLNPMLVELRKKVEHL